MNPATISMADYMNPQMFPLTTQAGLPPDKQMLIDAHNYDEFREVVESGRVLSEEEAAVGRELELKARARNVLGTQG